MVHVDSKQLARFDRVDHRINGDRRLDRSPGAGYEQAYMAIDDPTRLADPEVLPAKKKAATVSLLIGQWHGLAVRGLSAGGCSRTTATPTAPNPESSPVRPWG